MHVNKTVGLSGLPPVAASKVTVVENWAEVNRPYQVVGKGTLYRNAGGVPKGGALKQLRQMAGEMGADGVVGLHGTTSFRSALLVKWLTPGESARPVSLPFVVGLLPVNEGPKARGDRKVMREAVEMAVIHRIEPKGYYLLPAPVSGINGGIEQAQLLDAVARQEILKQNIQLLLEVDFTQRTELTLGVYNEATATLNIKLLDIGTGRIIYQNAGKGGGASTLVLSPGLSLLEEIVSPDDKRMKAIGNGIAKAFEDLPAISP